MNNLPLLFGYVFWDIWVSRCKKVFNAGVNVEPENAFDSYYRACLDSDFSRNCKFYAAHSIQAVPIANLSAEHVILETDGSVLPNGASGCGGVLKSPQGNWMGGFSCKLTTVKTNNCGNHWNHQWPTIVLEQRI